MDEIQRLLLKWQIIRIGYYEQLQKTEDAEIAKTILSMDFQLARCIEELENATGDERAIMARRLLTGIQNVNRQAENDSIDG